MKQSRELRINPFDGNSEQPLLSAWCFYISVFATHAIYTDSIDNLSCCCPELRISMFILFDYIVPTSNFLYV